MTHESMDSPTTLPVSPQTLTSSTGTSEEHENKFSHPQNYQPGLEVGSPAIVYSSEPIACASQSDRYPYRPWTAASPGAGSPSDEKGSKRQIMGLSVSAFWALVIVSIVILAGAVGGGVGGGLATQKANNANLNYAGVTETITIGAPSTMVTATPTDGGASTPTIGGGGTGATSAAPTDGGCPNINGTAYEPMDASGDPISLGGGQRPQSFVQLCNTNYPSGSDYGNPGIHDILKVYMASLQDCITACASYNVNYKRNLDAETGVTGGYCRSVAIIKSAGEYCYLKNGTGTNITFDSPEYFTSAVVLEGL